MRARSTRAWGRASAPPNCHSDRRRAIAGAGDYHAERVAAQRSANDVEKNGWRVVQAHLLEVEREAEKHVGVQLTPAKESQRAEEDEPKHHAVVPAGGPCATGQGGAMPRRTPSTGAAHWKWPWSMSTKGGASRIVAIAVSRSDFSRSEYRLQHSAAVHAVVHAAVQCGVVRCGAVLCGAVQCKAVRCTL
jgi:hypothetical protein